MEVPEGKRLQVFIIFYFLFITLVPDSPSYYRFMVDTVGCLLSLMSLVFLEMYLNSRPVNQKNILHSQHRLILYLHGLFTVRCWIVSAAGSLFHDITVIILQCYPTVFISLLVLGPYTILGAIAYCCMTVSKLILVISPATFQNLSAKRGFWISLTLALLIPLLDMILIEIKCGLFTSKTSDPFEYKIIFKYELGMLNKTFGEALENLTAFTKDNEALENMTISSIDGGSPKEQDILCSFLPVTGFVCFLTSLLELIKFALVIGFEVRKIPRENRTCILPLLPTLSQCKKSSVEPALQTIEEAAPNPADLYQETENNCSRVIYVLPVPETNENGDTIDPTLTSIEGIVPTQEATTSSVEIRTVAPVETVPDDEETAGTQEEPNFTTNEETAASENPGSTVQNPNNPKYRTVSETIKNTLRLFIFRTGSLSLIGFFVFIGAWIPMKSNEKELTLSPRVIVLLARYFAYFLPLAWILFDRDTRVYVFLKVKHLKWQRNPVL